MRTPGRGWGGAFGRAVSLEGQPLAYLAVSGQPNSRMLPPPPPWHGEVGSPGLWAVGSSSSSRDWSARSEGLEEPSSPVLRGREGWQSRLSRLAAWDETWLEVRWRARALAGWSLGAGWRL